MLNKFLERNENYNYTSKRLSEKTLKFTLFNEDTLDIINVTGQYVNKLHAKSIDKLKSLGYGWVLGCIFDPYYLIDGDIYDIKNGKFVKITGTTTFNLVQNMKTKSKIIAEREYNIERMLYDIIIERNMRGTKEKMLPTTPLYRRLYQFSTYTPDHLRERMNTHVIAVDADKNVIFEMPAALTKETMKEYNDILLQLFGTRNNKPIFEIIEKQLPQTKGENLC